MCLLVILYILEYDYDEIIEKKKRMSQPVVYYYSKYNLNDERLAVDPLTWTAFVQQKPPRINATSSDKKAKKRRGGKNAKKKALKGRKASFVMLSSTSYCFWKKAESRSDDEWDATKMIPIIEASYFETCYPSHHQYDDNKNDGVIMMAVYLFWGGELGGSLPQQPHCRLDIMMMYERVKLATIKE